MKTPKPGPARVKPAAITELVTVPETPPSPYKTIEEAAEFVKTTPWAIAQAIRANDLQAKKLGKRFVATVQWLNEWFEWLDDAA